ncbi:hypothetical protein NOG67_18410 [Erwinia persicina]|uniref:hypothetical protein n=1 Tax=Erwinia persicina TaxID=55211 RepID=UPI00210741AA|nr:hypothetical protein [Erwinia persicina]MCQ4103628.1 hypothetical protein [Erwinia persicina]UTX12297.1 hypothetical protein NOG67_18410 [Erwinia persicina]
MVKTRPNGQKQTGREEINAKKKILNQLRCTEKLKAVFLQKTKRAIKLLPFQSNSYD